MTASGSERPADLPEEEVAAVMAAIQAYLEQERAVPPVPDRSPAWRNASWKMYRGSGVAGPRSWRERT